MAVESDLVFHEGHGRSTVKVVHRIREKDIDEGLKAVARGLGVLSVKLTTLGARGTSGWPDRLFILPGGRVLWMELKAPGRKPTKLQESRIRQLRERGHSVWLVDSVDAGKKLLTEAMKL